MRLRTRLAGLAATLVVLAILIGMPALLVKVGGNPIPTRWPSPGQVGDWFTRPDDGTLALTALIGLGWLVWVFLALTLLLEIITLIGGLNPPALPGLRWPQLAAHQLVAAALLLFIAAPLTLAGARAAQASPPAAAPSPAPQPRATMPPDQARPVTNPAHSGPTTAARVRTEPLTHIVEPNDTLTGLAARYLGDPDRWPQIYRASTGITQPDGGRLTDPDLILVGWTLHIPSKAPVEPSRAAGVVHRVVEGDTLSDLARTHLGDADRWPEIFQASRNTPQPGGAKLIDPDLILPGWTLTIPAAATPKPALPRPITPGADHRPPLLERKPDKEQPVPRPPSAAPTQRSAPTSTNPQARPAAPATDQPSAVDLREPTLTHPVGDMDASWLLTGLAVGGAVLAGSAWLTLQHRRRAQFRSRRPGRAVTSPAPVLAPVAKTITAVGPVSAPTVRFMDQTLRRLGASRIAAGRPMPRLAAVELDDHRLTLHLAEPADLAEPWISAGADGLCWSLPHDASLDAVGPPGEGEPAPYPLLVTCGSTDSGDLWLLNLEHVATVRTTGDPSYAQDFLRYAAAELAVNPWSREVRITSLGVADEVAPMNPQRFRAATSTSQAIADIRADAEATLERADHTGTDAVTGRCGQLAGESWGAHALLIHAADTDRQAVRDLVALVEAQPDRTATAILVDGHTPVTSGPELRFTRQGRVLIGHLGLDLVAAGLTCDEAAGCAALLAQADRTQDTAMPTTSTATDGWRSHSDDAGAVREELIVPRSVPDAELIDATTGLIDDLTPLPASTAPEDLAQLAPRVPGQVRTRIEDADPTLDQDVADWFAPTCDRPRLTLLGPVAVKAHGTPIAKRKPFYIEMLAYVALREHGATPDEVADAFGYNPSTVRSSIKVIRDWLGTNPRTGERHLPDATKSRAALARGMAVYQVEDLLVDIDLFRRLRLRGQARGRDGLDDLVTALRLVTGRPFDQLRPNGWSWLVDLNIDNHMVCAIVDVAHLLTTHYLQNGDLAQARAATETALLAAPFETIPKLDLAAVAKAEGHIDEARRIIEQGICHEVDEDDLPADLGERTGDILAGLDWLTTQRAVI